MNTVKRTCNFLASVFPSFFSLPLSPSLYLSFTHTHINNLTIQIIKVFGLYIFNRYWFFNISFRGCLRQNHAKSIIYAGRFCWFFLSFVDILEIFHLWYHIYMANSIYHHTYYEMTNSVLSSLRLSSRMSRCTFLVVISFKYTTLKF